MKHFFRKTLLLAGLVSLAYRFFPQLKRYLHQESLPPFEGITHTIGTSKKHASAHAKKVHHTTHA